MNRSTMPGSELAPVGGPDNAAGEGEEDARQFILQVKQTVERCLVQGMNKAHMFRVIREEGLHPGAAFAVYKELRHQNHGFFKEYFCTIDLKEQRKRLDRLIRAYHTDGSNTAAGVRVPETVITPPIALETEFPVNTEWPNQQELQDWLSKGGDQFAPAAWPQQSVHLPARVQVQDHKQAVASDVVQGMAWSQQAVHLPAWEQLVANAEWPQQALRLPAGQQLHNHQQPAANCGFHGLVWPQQTVQSPTGHHLHKHEQPPVANGGFQGLAWQQPAVHLPAVQQQHYHEQAVTHGLPLTPAASLHNDAMMDPWPLSHGGPGLWQGQQAHSHSLQQWCPGPSTGPSPLSSLPHDDPPGNQNYYSAVTFHKHPQ